MKSPLPRPAIFFDILWQQQIGEGVWCNQGDGSLIRRTVPVISVAKIGKSRYNKFDDTQRITRDKRGELAWIRNMSSVFMTWIC